MYIVYFMAYDKVVGDYLEHIKFDTYTAAKRFADQHHTTCSSIK